MHQSVATLSNPEFINLQPMDINPLMSSCEIKVLYTGKNRNKSFISKEVATEMAKTLRGAPIVGYYKKDIEDFGDHGRQIIIEEGQIKMNCKTIPYGFVSPDAKVWFQDFEEIDANGLVVIRTYLMTTGYLWTGQFEECRSAVEGDGKPHSMEIDEDTYQGDWAHDVKTNMDFFIVNDAIFSKLCILGDDVEPCFEGSSITAPDVSTTFSKEEEFTRTLYTMMQQLQFALQGGQNMSVGLKTSAEDATVETPVVEGGDSTTDATTDFQQKEEDKKEKPSSDEKDNSSEGDSSKSDSASEDNGKSAEGEEDKKKKPVDHAKVDDEDDKKDEDDKEDEDDKKKSAKDFELAYNELSLKYEQLSSDFAALQTECESLRQFKLGIDTEKKTSLIESFYMLSDEDKKDVTEHITEYSLEDIEAKLSVICVRKKVSFDLDESKPESKQEEAPLTYSLEDDGVDSAVPAWIAAAKRVRDSK